MSGLINTSNNLPSYLNENNVNDVQRDMAEYGKTPFLKIVQQDTAEPYKPPFGDGDIIAVPAMKKVGGLDEQFTFVPIFAFPCFQARNPYKGKGAMAMFHEVSFDPNSELAKKCKKVNYEEQHPNFPNDPKAKIKFQTSLNFIVEIVDNPEFAGIQVCMFFSGGEYKTGQSLLGLLSSPRAPFYARRIVAVSGLHPNQYGKKTYGMNFTNDPQMWNTEEEFNRFAALKKQIEEDVRANRFELDPGAATEDSAANENKF